MAIDVTRIDFPPDFADESFIGFTCFTAGKNSDPTEIEIEFLEVGMDVVREGFPNRGHRVFNKNQDPAATAFDEDICERGIIGSKSIAGENHAMFEGNGNIEVVAIHEIRKAEAVSNPIYRIKPTFLSRKWGSFGWFLFNLGGILVFDDAVRMLILQTCPMKSRSMKANGSVSIARGIGIMRAAPTLMLV
jgi:hypothetical protein